MEKEGFSRTVQSLAELVIAPNSGQVDVAVSHKIGDCPELRPVVQHFDREVKRGKRPTVSLYLNELLDLKCVISEIKSNVEIAT